MDPSLNPHDDIPTTKKHSPKSETDTTVTVHQDMKPQYNLTDEQSDKLMEFLESYPNVELEFAIDTLYSSVYIHFIFVQLNSY